MKFKSLVLFGLLICSIALADESQMVRNGKLVHALCSSAYSDVRCYQHAVQLPLDTLLPNEVVVKTCENTDPDAFWSCLKVSGKRVGALAPEFPQILKKCDEAFPAKLFTGEQVRIDQTACILGRVNQGAKVHRSTQASCESQLTQLKAVVSNYSSSVSNAPQKNLQATLDEVRKIVEAVPAGTAK